MGTNERPATTRVPQWLASLLVGLVTSAAVAAVSFTWSIDRVVVTTVLKMDAIEARQVELRTQLRCNPMVDPHPICARLDRLDVALKRFHNE